MAYKNLIIGIVLIATLIILNFSLQTEDPPQAPMAPAANYDSDLIAIDSNGSAQLIIPVPVVLPNPSPIHTFTASSDELDAIRVGEIYWSASKPLARINGSFRGIGDVIGSYTVVSISRDAVYLRMRSSIVEFTANVRTGIQSDILDQRREALNNRLPQE